MTDPRPPVRPWLLLGLGLSMAATLGVEVLATRLLSVITWYHLSFFAVSTAMFGLAAGALRIQLSGDGAGGDSSAGPEAALKALARASTWLALSIPLGHAVNLAVPIRAERSLVDVAALALTTVALATPFYFAGQVAALALTRVPGRRGLTYAADLVGAALGCIAVLPALKLTDLSTVMLGAGAVAAFGAAAFHRQAGTGRATLQLALAFGLVTAAEVNHHVPRGLRVHYSKGNAASPTSRVLERWSLNGWVVMWPDRMGPPFYWGPGRGSQAFQVSTVPMAIDGEAGTAATQWDADPASLAWVEYDVTSLPYQLRRGGEVAVIGVGGGRDLLSALWAGSTRVTGIEVNHAFLWLLNGPLADYAGLAHNPHVRLVLDEARSWLTRTTDRFDVLQMSLIDSWAATGAGAFTLSENGLYTLEGWRVFLQVLKPGGIFSVSRWYAADNASETSRLMSLATAALLDQGIGDPRQHMALVARGRIATLLVGRSPLGPDDLAAIGRAEERFGFRVLLAPGREPADPLLGRITASANRAELAAVVAGTPYDYSPPTDDRPYFFNILRPSGFLRFGTGMRSTGVIARGNLAATGTLLLLCLLSAALVVAAILLPLWRSGLPAPSGRRFAQAAAYFALIGCGYMLVQIPLVQRFSPYLGHPSHAVVLTLFAMILATGIGSWLSDRIQVEDGSFPLAALSLGLGAGLLALPVLLRPLLAGTIGQGLAVRGAVAVAVAGIVALPLGACFPLGLRLSERLVPGATAWMWGLNGAFGVLATVTAVALSMWAGIDWSLRAAALAYLLLGWPAGALVRAARSAPAGRG